jgi:hypothetical protein
MFSYTVGFRKSKALMDDRNPDACDARGWNDLNRSPSIRIEPLSAWFAGEHLDECGFARAVFAEQGMVSPRRILKLTSLSACTAPKPWKCRTLPKFVVLLHGKNSLHKSMAAPEAKLRGQPFWRMTY